MMLVLKKNRLFSTVLILCLAVFGCGMLKTVIPDKEAFLPSEGRTIIIDAGHGAPDGGAVGKDGVTEKDLNLKVALALQKFFESGNTNVILTRSDDNGIYDVDGSIKNKKISDIKNREELINNTNADLFISIHMNKFPEEQYSGPQVFYSANNKNSELLAKCIQESMITSLNPENKREIKKADSNIYLLSHAKLPAVLVECGFLSNPQEAAKLNDEKYQRHIAWSVYCGIIQYFNEK